MRIPLLWPALLLSTETEKWSNLQKLTGAYGNLLLPWLLQYLSPLRSVKSSHPLLSLFSEDPKENFIILQKNLKTYKNNSRTFLKAIRFFFLTEFQDRKNQNHKEMWQTLKKQYQGVELRPVSQPQSACVHLSVRGGIPTGILYLICCYFV